MPSPPSTRPSDARERRLSASAREDSGTMTGPCPPRGSAQVREAVSPQPVRVPPGTGQSPGRRAGWPSRLGQDAAELAARGDAELGEDFGQVILDRAGTHEQPAAELRVRQ